MSHTIKSWISTHMDQAINLQLHKYEYRNELSNGTSLVALSTCFNCIQHLSKNTVEPPYATSSSDHTNERPQIQTPMVYLFVHWMYYMYTTQTIQRTFIDDLKPNISQLRTRIQSYDPKRSVSGPVRREPPDVDPILYMTPPISNN